MNLLSRFKDLVSHKNHNYTTFLEDYPVLFHSKIMSNKPKTLGKFVVNYSKAMIEKLFQEYIDNDILGNNSFLFLKGDSFLDKPFPKIYFYTQKNYVDDITYSYISLFSGKSFSDIKGKNLKGELELDMNETMFLNQIQLIGVDANSLDEKNIKRDGFVIVDNIDLLARSKKDLENYLRQSAYPLLIGSLEEGDISLLQKGENYKLVYKNKSVTVGINESNKISNYCYERFKKEVGKLVDSLPVGYNNQGELEKIDIPKDKSLHIHLEGEIGSGMNYFANQILLNKEVNYFDQMFNYRADFKEELLRLSRQKDYVYVLLGSLNSINFENDDELVEIFKQIDKNPKVILITTSQSGSNCNLWDFINPPSVMIKINKNRKLEYNNKEYCIPFLS